VLGGFGFDSLLIAKSLSSTVSVFHDLRPMEFEPALQFNSDWRLGTLLTTGICSYRSKICDYFERPIISRDSKDVVKFYNII
jgi:hypothetical protein